MYSLFDGPVVPDEHNMAAGSVSAFGRTGLEIRKCSYQYFTLFKKSTIHAYLKSSSTPVSVNKFSTGSEIPDFPPKVKIFACNSASFNASSILL